MNLKTLLLISTDTVNATKRLTADKQVLLFDEKRLLQLITKNDRTAFDQLVTLKWNNIYAQALTYVKSTHTAQDIVQEVFLKVWENRHKLSEIERFDSYIFIIARNYIISELRKKIALPLSDFTNENLEEAFREPDKILHQSQLVSIITKGIQLLPPQQNIAYRLSRDEGLSYEEIAHKMSLSKETVKKHICKALNFLRTYVRTNSELALSLLIVLANGL